MSRERIIVFDGVCVLCSGWVGFVLKRDRRANFKFAAMQTPTGRALLAAHGVDPDAPSTFLVIDDGAHTDTDALIRVLLNFNMGWRFIASLLRIVPHGIRDAAYRLLARNRYRLFGRRVSCYVPPMSLQERFLK